MLRKLLVAVLACITLFLSQRALTDSRPRSVPQVRSETAHEAETGGAAKVTRTAVLF